MKLTRNILYKVSSTRWILLPAVSQPQDHFIRMLVKNTGKRSVLVGRQAIQADGSRLNLLAAHNMDAHHIKHKVMEASPDYGEPYIPLGTPDSVDFFLADPDRFTYIAYHTHTFLNGKRYIPIMLDNKLYGYWRVQELFPHLVPEDNLGLLVSDRDQMDIHPDHFVIRGENIIPFLSYVRLCSKCGRVSDHSKPMYEPWLYYDNTRYKPEEQKVTPEQWKNRRR